MAFSVLTLVSSESSTNMNQIFFSFLISKHLNWHISFVLIPEWIPSKKIQKNGTWWVDLFGLNVCWKLIVHLKYVWGSRIFLKSSAVNGILLWGCFFTENFIPENGLETINPCLTPQLAKTLNLVSRLLIFCKVWVSFSGRFFSTSSLILKSLYLGDFFLLGGNFVCTSM